MDPYKLTENDGVFRLTLSGRLTYNDHNEMKKIVLFFKENKTMRVIIDMAKLTFIDSAAVGILLIMAEEVHSFNGIITIENPIGQVARVLTAAKIIDLFQIPHA